MDKPIRVLTIDGGGTKSISEIMIIDYLEKFYAAGTSEPVVKYLEKPSLPVPRQLRRVAVRGTLRPRWDDDAV